MAVCMFEDVTKSYTAAHPEHTGLFPLLQQKIPEAGQFAQRKEAYLSRDLVAGILHSRGVGSSERSSHKEPNTDMASRDNQNC